MPNVRVRPPMPCTAANRKGMRPCDAIPAGATRTPGSRTSRSALPLRSPVHRLLCLGENRRLFVDAPALSPLTTRDDLHHAGHQHTLSTTLRCRTEQTQAALAGWIRDIPTTYVRSQEKPAASAMAAMGAKRRLRVQNSRYLYHCQTADSIGLFRCRYLMQNVHRTFGRSSVLARQR
jgi:hypothetical protein